MAQALEPRAGYPARLNLPWRVRDKYPIHIYPFRLHVQIYA
jgi:hypothetical protein